ncbi:MAG: hypothetical protein JOZ62_05920 [Acidobacteriaceae bacterium]|nr:hypothetical protein [Acidobacteriaceae bacterium]
MPAGRAVVEQRKTPAGTYRLELVKCGKAQCKVCRGGPAHGPYWYVYWKQKGRTGSEYIGKKLKQRKVRSMSSKTRTIAFTDAGLKALYVVAGDGFEGIATATEACKAYLGGPRGANAAARLWKKFVRPLHQR